MKSVLWTIASRSRKSLFVDAVALVDLEASQARRDNLKILVMITEFSDYSGKLAIQFLVGFQHLPESHECPHDRNINLDCSLAAQHAGKHCYALLGECVGKLFSVMAATTRL